MPQSQLSILLWHEQTQGHELECFCTMSIQKNHFMKEKYRREPV